MTRRGPSFAVRAVPSEAATPGAGRRTKLIFMYGGQGTQYRQMGRGLLDTNPVFRDAMHRCDARYRAVNGAPLVAEIYDGSRAGQDFDDIGCTSAALYGIGCALTEVLRDEGFHPDGVLGHSLGEYVAATVAGVMSFEDGLDLVLGQARLLRRGGHGGMLAILADPGLYRRRRDLFGGVALAAVNFAGNFVVSGERGRLDKIQAKLDQEGLISVPLPVSHAFHSDLLDDMRWDLLTLGAKLAVRDPVLPVYSSALAGQLGAATLERWDEYLWDVIRRPVRFDELMTSAFTAPDDYFFVDLSATGSLANFLKHGYGGTFRCVCAINQFGNDESSMRSLREQLLQVT